MNRKRNKRFFALLLSLVLVFGTISGTGFAVGAQENQTETATEAMTAAVTEAVTEAMAAAETEAVTEAMAAAETEAATEAMAAAETEAVTEAMAAAETEAVTGTEAAEGTWDTAADEAPVGESTHETESQTAADEVPAGESTTETETESVAEEIPAGEDIDEPETETDTEDEDYGVMAVASYTGLVYTDENQGVTFGFVSTDGSTDVNLTDMTRTDSGGTITTTISAGRNKGTADTVTSYNENIKVTVPSTFIVDGTTYTVTGYYGGISYARYGIKEIHWPTTLTTMTGGQNAFRYYQNLTSLTIPGTVKNPEVGGFYSPSISSLTLEEGVETYNTKGSQLWSKCSTLTTVSLPSTLTTLGGYTFYGATGISSISLPDGLTSIGSGAFDGCTALTSIVLPSGITEIPTYLFYGCSTLGTVTFRGTVTSVGAEAFRECSALEEVDVSAVTEMGVDAFYGCSTLKKINISLLTDIPNYAFYKCSALATVTLNAKLTSIGNYAFANCTALCLGSLEACTSLTDIGKYAFYGCMALVGSDTYTYKVTQDSSEPSQYTQDEATGTETIYQTVFTIPDSVVSIGEKAFYGAGNVTAFWVGSGINATTTNLFANNVSLNTVIFNNARENVTILSDSVPGTVTAYVWLEESIGDVGEKISDAEDAEGALTLQQAVNYIAGIYKLGENDNPVGIDRDQGVITISKSIKLKKGLVIPENCTVTITSENAYTIEADSAAEATVDTLITVNESANLSLSGPITVSGLFNEGSVASVKGTLNIREGITIRKAAISSNSTGVIDADGSNAAVNISGGSIQDNIITGNVSAVVRVSGGATLNMGGGKISNNRETSGSATGGSNSSAGVAVYQGTFNMSGGEISGNTGSYGGAAVKIYNPSNASYTPSFNMSGGVISGNGYSITGSSYTSGAVYIYGQSEFSMSGGKITENSGYMGGGVSVLSYWDGVNSSTFKFAHAKFTMTGGAISGNTAASAGGGIYSFSMDVTLSGGFITGNSAGKMGGGIYCEGGKTDGQYGSVKLLCALVTDNLASKHGGGMWLCPTGSAVVLVENGGAVAGNTANEAGDDVVSGKSASQSNYTLSLANRILGGGAVAWYKDGSAGVTNLDGNGFTVTVDSTRYAEGESTLYESIVNYQGALSLKAVLADASALSYATCRAKLFITDNTAVYGGGIGSNGGVVIGEEVTDLVTASVKKVWKEADGNPVTDTENMPEVRVQLIGASECGCGDCTNSGCVCGNAVLDTAVLNQTNNWSHTWTDLPSGDYSVVETAVEGYTGHVYGSATENGFEYVIENVPDGSLTVSKTLSGNAAGVYADKEFTFTVTLDNSANSAEKISGTYGDMEFTDGVATFTLKGGESKTATSLPAGVTYTVTESDNDGYTVTKTVDGTTVDEATGTIVSGETSKVAFNNHKDEFVSVSGSKTWDDADNQDGKRPESITIRLYADGVEIDSATVTEADGWGWGFTGLDKYRDGGVEIVYTITEDAVSEYATTYDGYNVANSHTPKQTSVTVTKAWSDADNQDGIRPDSITVVLLADGVETGQTLTLNGDNGWTGSFTGLDEYKDSVKIVYTIKEISVDGYETTITGDASEGFVVTNTHVPEEPDEPDTPDNPNNPDTPDNPNNPDTPDNPNNPNTPDTPSSPNNPGTSGNPDNPSGGSDGTTSTDTPKTGDETNLALWVSLMCLALAGLAGTGIAYRKRKDAGKSTEKQ